MSDIGDWFRSIPAITRYWFAATVAVPLIGKLGIISPAYFFLWPEAFLYRFQVVAGVWQWRLQPPGVPAAAGLVRRAAGPAGAGGICSASGSRGLKAGSLGSGEVLGSGAKLRVADWFAGK